jgi:hypothetical protein
MKKWLLATVIGVLAVSSACTNEKKEETKAETKVEVVNVEVKTNPETIKVNEKIEVQAIVTQGTDKVTDADIEFEIAKKGEKGEKTVGTHKADGVYVVEKIFDSEGVYEVTPHTNARGMHVMPKVEITVGNGEHKAGAHGGHGASETALHFMTPKDAKANAHTTLTMHVQHKKEALAGAKAKFEIWKEGQEKHEFVDAKETKAGEYQAVTKFPEAGTYNVKLHVEKGDIHEHTDEKVEVK